MDLETKILVLLSNQKGLSENLITDILKISLDQKKPVIKKALLSLEKAGAIDSVDGLFKITGNGLKRLPRAKGKLEYDIPYWLKSWTMLIFEIPESQKNKRDKLRYRLKKHNFGMIQNSVWISPREIPDSISLFVTDKDLSSMVQSLKFSVSKEDNHELISRAWQVNKLNQEYREYVEEAKERFNLVKEYNWNSKDIKRRTLKMLAEDFKHRYHLLAKKDPKLPKTILPSDWQGFRAHHIYQQLYKYL